MALELWRHRGMGRPFRELARMEREMGDLFGRFFQDWSGAGLAERGRAWTPAVDMIDRPDEVVVRADLPGLEQKDVDGILEVHLQKSKESKGKKIEIKAE